MRTYRAYTEQDVIQKSGQTRSIAGLLGLLGLRKSGGNYSHLRKTLQRLGLKCEHWTGQAWSKDQQQKDWSAYSRVRGLKKRLLKIQEVCQKCKIDLWNGEPLTLEVHHLNGDRTDNRLENLQILCPNCHSQTKNFRNKKRPLVESADTLSSNLSAPKRLGATPGRTTISVGKPDKSPYN